MVLLIQSFAWREVAKCQDRSVGGGDTSHIHQHPAVLSVVILGLLVLGTGSFGCLTGSRNHSIPRALVKQNFVITNLSAATGTCQASALCLCAWCDYNVKVAILPSLNGRKLEQLHSVLLLISFFV